MNALDKIYIAGHRGMVGSAVVRQLEKRGFKNIITRLRKELDLTNQKAVVDFFKKEKPDYVILAAAKVGGIYANNTYPADFIYQNIMIQSNVIHEAWRANVKSLLFLGSSCIYPKMASQPISEDELLTGVLEPTNEPYGIAKIAGIKLCESYNRQYGTDFRSVMPTNLYGINDNFHPQNSHVIPGLIRRFDAARNEKSSKVIVWGSGKPMREFLYVDDMASASLFVLGLDKNLYYQNLKPTVSHINIGTGKDVAIQELAETIAEIVGFQGNIVFDKTKPDGPPKKLTNIKRITDMGWEHNTPLREGLIKTYNWYRDNYKNSYSFSDHN